MQYFIIGEKDLVLAFSLVGVSGKVVSNRDEALQVFKAMTSGSDGKSERHDEEIPRVLILTEHVAAMLEEEVFKWQKKGAFPLIVDIPGINGHEQGHKSLSDAIREAIGIKI